MLFVFRFQEAIFVLVAVLIFTLSGYRLLIPLSSITAWISMDLSPHRSADRHLVFLGQTTTAGDGATAGRPLHRFHRRRFSSMAALF